MAQGIDLTAQKWLDLIFEKKNRNYGAYVMRNESSDRHLKSLIIVTIVGLSAIFLPRLVTSVIPEKVAPPVIEEVTLVDIKQEVPEENQIKQLEAVPPPPALKETIKMTEIVIKQDEEVSDDDLQESQEKLSSSTAGISVATVENGSKDGVDIADIQDHKIVVQDEAPVIMDFAEVPPAFPGGMDALNKWLSKNVHYPSAAQEQGIAGRVIVRFAVMADGSIGNITVARKVDPALDKEAIRAVQSMPKWIPGKQNGVAVNVYFTLPVTFKMEGV
ncbi:MAG: TonB family protein [Candidatus Symbiothrix sp.]|jgi:protein TonB|nr:TonB family protein [Candidatus Symbiothrix sp.]